MLDIQFVRENSDLVTETSKQKGIKIDINKLLELDDERRKAIAELEQLQHERNSALKELQGKKPSADAIKRGKVYKQSIAESEAAFKKITTEYESLLEQVPNVYADDTPLGGEEANQAVKHHGQTAKKDAQDHLSWGEERGYIDFERGAKVAGNKFYYTKGPLVELELACIQLAVSVAAKHGFTPITVPHMVNQKTINGTGFSPRGEEDQIYTIEGEDLSLIATSEIPITGYYAQEILNREDLPILYVGISPSYRKEAGAYGKHSKGLYRVHQFNKVEMYVFCEGDLQTSQKWHQKLLDIEEELCQALEIPYQLVRIAAGDLGAPAYKKYDIEYWSPLDNSYRELTSCSNVTDYQARRLNIRYRGADGKPKMVHTLNGTAVATSRTLIALIENHQQKDGHLAVPKRLQPYMDGKEKI